MSGVPKKNGLNIVDEIFNLFEIIIITVFIVSMIFTFFLKLSTVKGSSMQDTLMPEEKLLVYSFYFTPKNGDVIIIDACKSVIFDDDYNIVLGKGIDKKIVKRVVATEGQVIDIDFDRGIVYLDGIMLDEPYITSLTHIDEGSFTDKYPIKIPEGYVFVMGDNRSVSKDSRSIEIGLVSIDNIIGKVFFRISPLSELGFIS